MKTLTTVTFLLLFGLVDLMAQKQINQILIQNFNGSNYINSDSIQYNWSNLENDKSIYDWFVGGGLGPGFFYEGIATSLYDDKTTYKWNSNSNDYFMVDRVIHQLNTRGLIDKMTVASFNLDSAAMRNSRQHRYQYNLNGDVTQENLGFWSDSLGWTDYVRVIRRYKSDGQLDSLFSESYFNSKWNIMSLNTYSYSNGKLVEKLTQDRPFNQSYQNSRKILYTEDFAAGTETETLEEWSRGQWVMAGQAIKYFGLPSQIDSIKVNIGRPIKREFYYDNDRLEEVIFSNFNLVQNLYYPQERYLVSYSPKEDTVRVLEQSIDPSGWITKSGDRFYNYYYNTSVGINENVNEIQFDIFPNPSTDQINITAENIVVDQIRIVDLSGKIVFESNARLNSSKITVPVHHLSNGTYVLTVGSNGVQTSKKIVVRR